MQANADRGRATVSTKPGGRGFVVARGDYPACGYPRHHMLSYVGVKALEQIA